MTRRRKKEKKRKEEKAVLVVVEEEQQQQQQQQHVVTPASARKRTRREQNNNEDTTTTTNNSNSMLNDDNDNNFVQEIQTTPINTPTFVGVEIKEVLRRLYDLDLIKNRLNADGTFIENYFDVAYDLNHTQKGLFVSGLQVMFASCSPQQLLQLQKVKEATDQEINHVYREVSQQTLDFMLLLEKEGPVCDSNGIFGTVVPPPASASKKKRGGKSRHGKPLSAVGSRAVKWKKCVKYGKRLQEKNYHTSMISCCNERNIVVPCSTLDYFGNNDDTNNNNNDHTNNTTNTNRSIQGNNNNNTNQSNNSSAIYSKNNDGYAHAGLMVGMEQMT